MRRCILGAQLMRTVKTQLAPIWFGSVAPHEFVLKVTVESKEHPSSSNCLTSDNVA